VSEYGTNNGRTDDGPTLAKDTYRAFKASQLH